MWNVDKIMESLRDRMFREALNISRKGKGWIVGFRSCGSYIECWTREVPGQKRKRLIEFNFFDNHPRDSEWAHEANLALTAALHWQDTGVMLGKPKKEKRSAKPIRAATKDGIGRVRISSAAVDRITRSPARKR